MTEVRIVATTVPDEATEKLHVAVFHNGELRRADDACHCIFKVMRHNAMLAYLADKELAENILAVRDVLFRVERKDAVVSEIRVRLLVVERMAVSRTYRPLRSPSKMDNAVFSLRHLNQVLVEILKVEALVC